MTELDLQTSDELTLGDDKLMSVDERQEAFQKYAARAQMVRVTNLAVGDELDIIAPYRYFAKVLKKQGNRVLVECDVQGAKQWKAIWGPAFTEERKDRGGKVTQEKEDLHFDSVVEDGRADGDQATMSLVRKPIHAIRLDSGDIDKKRAEWAEEERRRRELMRAQALANAQVVLPLQTGEQHAGNERSAEVVGVREEGREVGSGTPLRQPGKTAQAQKASGKVPGDSPPRA